MKDKYSVVTIDDHSLIREGIKSIVNKSNKFNIAGEADNADDGYKVVTKIRPDIVLLDISLHGQSGFEIGKKLLKEDPSIKIIILTMHSKTQYIIDALKNGIKGYILKDNSPINLITAMEKVIQGEIFIDSYISNKVISELLPDNVEKSEISMNKSSYESLTEREQEILKKLVSGHSTREIGSELFISFKTVENHKASIMSKLKCKNMVELMRFALETGLVDLSAN
ncbi:MAG: response regulator transcription factor [Spirochaetaceae bacterium]|nr:response regulator transcription factor [Spirochaetaceae bacterium]